MNTPQIAASSKADESAVSAVPDTTSRVITFYSYKGGVGRSMALANIAVLLARDYQQKVIIVDWDLEAPGLHKFFNIADRDIDRGIIDYLHNYKALVRDPKTSISAADISIERYLRDVASYPGGGTVRLLPAGDQRDRAKYSERVRGFDWENFYRDWNGAQAIETLRAQFKTLAAFTLLDSRTGVTDVGGICTVQLPDTVVFVFVFNDQNLAGVEQVALELTNEENIAIKALGRRPDMLFLPSRKELSEVARLREWEGKAADRLGRFCDTPVIRETYGSVTTYLRKVSIPYVPYFAYGEELATASEKGYEMAEAFEPLLSMLRSRDHNAQLPEAKQVIERQRVVALGVLGVGFVTLFFAFAFLYFGLDYFDVGGKRAEWWQVWRTPFLGLVAGGLGSVWANVLAISARNSLNRALDRWVQRVLLDLASGACLGLVATLLFDTVSRSTVFAVALVAGFFAHNAFEKLSEIVTTAISPLPRR